MSENEHYFIPDKDNGALFVRELARAPRSSNPQLTMKRYNSKRYQEYRSQDFINDCLHTAEEINAGRTYVPGSDAQSQVTGGAKLFGNDHKTNIELAQKHAVDEKAAPGLGEAYVIVNKKWLQKVGKYPYHAAAVVAVDGDDRVTLEVCATDEDAVMRDTTGTYNMYETKSSSGKTFHSHWKGEFAGADPATLVIKPK